jgi:hypothetical protein
MAPTEVADQEVRTDAPLIEGLERAGLGGAEARAIGENERDRHGLRIAPRASSPKAGGPLARYS